MNTRRAARERVMQALYAYEQGGGSADENLRMLIYPNIEDELIRAFAERLFLRTIERTPECDAIVADFAKNWDLNRIALVDRMVLRMAITEMLDFEDVPPKVTINEAIEIVKQYSTARSGQFINGLLDSILARLLAENRVRKSGRGLVGMPPRPADPS